MRADPTPVKDKPIQDENDLEFRDPVETLGEELLDRRRRGETVSIDEYVRTHPELAVQIRLQFPVMIALEKFKESTLSAPSEPYEVHVDAPTALGDYQIIREIGRGAMGVVYEAEQQSLQRRVAVKVFPKQTLREARKLERFARESKMAARLHHNNIVPVFGVGHHDGLHYFVMQRIDGLGLDEIIERARVRPRRDHSREDTLESLRHSASTSGNGSNRSLKLAALLDQSVIHNPTDCQRPEADFVDGSAVAEITSSFDQSARVGIQVAEAIHYAHSQGVLHRDIKPSNLMIDPNGTVWVTDFGLATALQQEQRVDRNDIAGTLRFMAPEQLSGKHDTRSDIYSLGVTLYELITLQPAFVAVSKAGVVDRILKGEFKRPRDARPQVPRDLEAIVLKAMALKPEDRYQNGQAFADDLSRFIARRPIRAKRTGGIGRFVRWARREPLAATLVGMLALVICTSFVLVSSKWREAVSERQRAESNLVLALESMDQILGRFTSSWMARPSEPSLDSDEAPPAVELQMLVSDHSASLMEDAIRFYDRFAADNAPSPRLQWDTARVHRRAGDIYQRLGQFSKAQHAYVRCLEILTQQPDRNKPSHVLLMASTLNQLGQTKHASSDFPDAQAAFLQARNLLQSNPYSEDAECRAELARTYSNLGQSHWMMMHHDDAKQSHRKAVSIMEKLVDQLPDNPSYRLALARAYRAYYPFAWDRRNDEREEVRAAGIAILDELVVNYPNVPDYQCELSEILIATNHRSRRPKDFDKLIGRLQRGIAIAHDLTRSYPAIPRYQVALALGLKTMANALDRSNPDEALAQLDEAIEIYRTLTRNFPDVPAYHLLCAMALRQHAESCSDLELYADAKSSAEEGVSQIDVYQELRPGNSFSIIVLAKLYDEIAMASLAMDEPAVAEAAQTKAGEIRSRWGTRRGR